MLQNKSIKVMFVIFILLSLSFVTLGEKLPTNPSILSNRTETITPKPLAYLNTSGGSFTTLVLNASQQNYKWKAYVGNVTGKLSLQDQTNYSIYDWKMSTISGNVYVSRNSSIDWSNLTCANRTTISNEDSYLNMNPTGIDNINQTFNMTTHKQFYAAAKRIDQSTCPAISTYVNGTAQTNGQNNKFQEILLQDIKGSILYTTIIESQILGFDNSRYDFQMIVAEDETKQVSTPYYFYMELI